MKLARAIHLDDSDTSVYEISARTGEWVISGGFQFSNWTEDDLTGKRRQAFTNGLLGLETLGRVTLAAVTRIEDFELGQLEHRLAQHFVDVYGAPSLDAAMPAAKAEIADMIDLCREQPDNTLLTVRREFSDAGVREQFRTIAPEAARLEQFAVHAGPSS